MATPLNVLHVEHSYHIAGNFREAEIFTIFATQGPLVKIFSRNAFSHVYTCLAKLCHFIATSSLQMSCSRSSE